MVAALVDALVNLGAIGSNGGGAGINDGATAVMFGSFEEWFPIC
jgi:hypothetical protein